MVELDVGHDARSRAAAARPSGPIHRPRRPATHPPRRRSRRAANLASDQEGGIAAEPSKGSTRSSRPSSSCRASPRRPPSAGARPARPAARRGRGRKSSYALETKTSQPGGDSGSAEIATGMPAARTRSAIGSVVAVPPGHLGAPGVREQRVRAHAGATNSDDGRSSLPARAGKRDQLLGDGRRQRRDGRARAWPPPSSPGRPSSSSSAWMACSARPISGSGTTTAPPPRSK